MELIMSLKMKHLMEQTGESKSTILFYVKEGLLPEPEKPKPNLHLYDESCINIIKFIKYLQNQFSYTISQIQGVFKEGKFTFSDDFSMMLRSLELMAGSPNATWYNDEDFLEIAELKEEELNKYLAKGWLFKQEKGFSSKELQLVGVFKRAESLNLDEALFNSYVASAIKMAEIEYALGSEMLESDKTRNNEHYELLFDAILTLKPYIFNMHTMQEHQQQMDLKNKGSKK
ncbi:MAG: Transcriptional regulator, MerR family [uncultured Sulfurovum sp.]|uniref:Transcriptional regulator, MerR family n=1 Tax=uncultured Sulfurovum sp. TaxID=269237 RepID=A0A6S6S5W3_9BACT|nr:MAG: Transcriptional regulator, MerR family [uncultured Sulfurovum sp.]